MQLQASVFSSCAQDVTSGQSKSVLSKLLKEVSASVAQPKRPNPVEMVLAREPKLAIRKSVKDTNAPEPSKVVKSEAPTHERDAGYSMDGTEYWVVRTSDVEVCWMRMNTKRLSGQ